MLLDTTSIPPGPWGIGVSGGADSVALLAILCERMKRTGDFQLHVIHLDHQTRGEDSTADAGFVADLAARRELACTVATRDRIEAAFPTIDPNPSARYRKARLGLFRSVVEGEKLQGVILAHHAGDQAETIFQRLVRGGSFVGLHGMATDNVVAGVRLLRPLLSVAPVDLRKWLTDCGLPWREDASNRSPQYQRNRVRQILAAFPTVASDLLALGIACVELGNWTEAHAPLLAEQFTTADLLDVPELFAAHAARRWLAARGVAAGDIGPATIARLLAMARDPASPPRQHFPGRLVVRRRRGVIWTEVSPRNGSFTT